MIVGSALFVREVLEDDLPHVDGAIPRMDGLRNVGNSAIIRDGLLQMVDDMQSILTVVEEKSVAVTASGSRARCDRRATPARSN